MSATTQGSDPGSVLRSVLDLLAVPAIAVDDAGGVLAVNAAAAARLSVALPEATGRPVGEVAAGLEGCVRLPLDADVIGGAVLVWPGPAGVDATAIELQKADTFGRLAGGISHDLANPLGAILTLASMIASEPGVPEDLQEPAGLLRDEADRTLRLVRSTLEFARHRPPAKSRIAIGRLVRECLELCASATASLDVRVTVSEVMPELEADAAKLRQAVLAVLVAAVEAMGGNWTQRGPTATGHLRIAGYLAETGGRYCAHLAIDDTGPVDPLRERATLLDGVALHANRDVAVAAALV
jgi:signal transduction histidine kinase